MNNNERIEAARRKKEEGNVLFKSGKYQRAAKKYNKVRFLALPAMEESNYPFFLIT